MDARGMTLMEIMMVVVILGIMASITVVSQDSAVEAGKRRAAGDVLQAIYAGERVYKTINKQYCTPNPAVPPPDCTWDNIYVDDPANAIRGVAFTVEVTAGNAGFNATATRNGGRCDGRTLTINDTTPTPLGGTWPATGHC